MSTFQGSVLMASLVSQRSICQAQRPAGDITVFYTVCGPTVTLF